MNTDLQPRESAGSGAGKTGEGEKYGTGVKAEPARKVKDLKTVKNSTIQSYGHNI